MDNILNETTNEVKSLLDLTKDNLPSLYQTLVKEHVWYSTLENLSFFFLFVAALFTFLIIWYDHVKKPNKWWIIIASVTFVFWVLSITCFITKNLVAPNYSFLLQILDKQ